MEMRQRIKIAVVLQSEMIKICQKEAGCIIFSHQNFHGGDDPIKLYFVERRCLITTEGAWNIFFSDGTVEECVGFVEAEKVVKELVALANLVSLVEDEVGLIMYIVPTNDNNYSSPESIPESTNQEEEVYNVDLRHYCINDGV